MEKMTIKSFYGDYEVHFENEIDYERIVQPGDIVVIDRKVYDIFIEKFKIVLADDNTIVIDANEEKKSYIGLIPIIDIIIAKGFRKNNTLIAVGGGIIQDCVAFIASILYRGVDWELIPTTLLAQCDSCIGSKTSINFATYKNQLGGFYPPRNIYISPSFLEFLDDREIKSGLGEMLHYYVIGGENDFEFFEQNCVNAKDDCNIMQKLIRRSLEIKKSYIEIDEYDRNERQIFNYGHSFGHALESMTDYELPHGIAVSYGIDIANYISEKKGLLDVEDRQRIRNVAKRFWSDDDISGVELNKYVELLKRDKKNKGNKLGVILCSGFGKLAKYMVYPDDEFCGWIDDYFRERYIE